MSGPFVDLTNFETEEVSVPCVCDGSPHITDTVTIRKEFSGAEIAQINGAMFKINAEGQAYADASASDLVAMELAVVGWSFMDGGMPIPFDRSLVNRMKSAAWNVVNAKVDEKVAEAKRPLAAASPPIGSSNTPNKESSIVERGSRSSRLSSSTPIPTSASPTSTESSKDPLPF